MRFVELKPSDIRYSKDLIQDCFKDGTPLVSTLQQLLHGNITPSSLQEIAVFKQLDGTWRVYAGNRRLYLYKLLESLDIIEKIVVRKLECLDDSRVRRITSIDGHCVTVRNGMAFKREIEKVIQQWRVGSYVKTSSWPVDANSDSENDEPTKGYYASRTQREASSSESDSDNELCAGRTQREVSNWSGDQFQSSRHSDNGGLKMTTADSNAGNIVLGVGAVALASVAAVGLYNWWNSGSKTTDSEKKKNKP